MSKWSKVTYVSAVSAAVIALAMVPNAWATPALNSSTDTSHVTGRNITVHGHAQFTTVFTPEQSEQEQALMEKLIEKAAAMKHLNAAQTQDLIAQMKRWYQTEPNGEVDLNINAPHCEVTIGNQTVETDAKGNFTVTLPPGKYEAQLKSGALSGHTTLYSTNVTLMSGQDITLTDSNTAQQAADQMNRNMNMSSSQNSSSMSMTSMSKTSSSSMLTPQGIVYGPYYPGEYVGSGLGKMLIIDWANHVSCNKSSNSNGGSDFPINNSDCTNSIAAGYLWAEDPIDYDFYSDGYVCVEEAMNRVDNFGSANPYCNDQPNSGSKAGISDWVRGGGNEGFNCSSFPFIGHVETLDWYSNIDA